MKVQDIYNKLGDPDQVRFCLVFGNPEKMVLEDGELLSDLIYDKRLNAYSRGYGAFTFLLGAVQAIEKDAEMDTLDFGEILDKFCEDKRFEGDSGVVEFEKVIAALGYDGHHQSYLHRFLADNPGAFEALIDWIGGQSSHVEDQWKENMIAHMRGDEQPHEM